MSQREMEAVLKALDALACAACVFVCALVIPGVESEGSVPAGSVPCFAVGIAPLLALGAVSWGLFSEGPEPTLLLGASSVSVSPRRLKRLCPYPLKRSRAG